MAKKAEEVTVHPPGDIVDPKRVRVITVRMTPELHAALREESFERRTSVNKLCIAKLRLAGSLLDKALKDGQVKISKR